jgi:hypothetical protein
MNLSSDFGARAAVHAARLDWTCYPRVDRCMPDRIGDELARATSIVRHVPHSCFSRPPTAAARSSRCSTPVSSRKTLPLHQALSDHRLDQRSAGLGADQTVAHGDGEDRIVALDLIGIDDGDPRIKAACEAASGIVPQIEDRADQLAAGLLPQILHRAGDRSLGTAVEAGDAQIADIPTLRATQPRSGACRART